MDWTDHRPNMNPLSCFLSPQERRCGESGMGWPPGRGGAGGREGGLRVRVVTRLGPLIPGWGTPTRSHATALLRQLPRLRHRAARQGEPGPRGGRGRGGAWIQSLRRLPRTVGKRGGAVAFREAGFGPWAEPRWMTVVRGVEFCTGPGSDW